MGFWNAALAAGVAHNFLPDGGDSAGDLSADQAKKAAQFHSFNEASQAFRSPWCAVSSMCAGEIPDKEVSVMSDKMDAKNAKAPTPLDIFEGIKGRPPETDRELEEWLASAEGKAAMMFEPASTTRWGEGRS
jgi:hypothetical protein